jgi:hypothetical protein
MGFKSPLNPPLIKGEELNMRFKVIQHSTSPFAKGGLREI